MEKLIFARLAPDPVPKVTRDKLDALCSKMKREGKDGVIEVDLHKISPLQLSFLGGGKKSM